MQKYTIEGFMRNMRQIIIPIVPHFGFTRITYIFFISLYCISISNTANIQLIFTVGDEPDKIQHIQNC